VLTERQVRGVTRSYMDCLYKESVKDRSRPDPGHSQEIEERELCTGSSHSRSDGWTVTSDPNVLFVVPGRICHFRTSWKKANSPLMQAKCAGGAAPTTSLLVLQTYFRDILVQAECACVKGLILGCSVYTGLNTLCAI
jgi:hypothetical protein